ncbi:MAG: hypothetical protein CMK77_10710 [Pseudomonadales bacterium]|nr:hypothetical protein [Pseudomonadales bacterium]
MIELLVALRSEGFEVFLLVLSLMSLMHCIIVLLDIEIIGLALNFQITQEISLGLLWFWQVISHCYGLLF